MTDWLFHPHPMNVLAQSQATLTALLAVPLTGALGPTPAFNLALMGTLWACALSAYALAWHLTRDVGGSLLAGFVFAFSPGFQQHLAAHLNVASLAALPLLVLTLVRLARAPGIRRAVEVGLAGAGCVGFGLQQAVYALALGLWTLAVHRGRRLAAHLLLALAVGTLALAPLLISVVPAYLGRPAPIPLWGMAEYGGIDLLAPALPGPRHPWLGEFARRARESFASRGDRGVLQEHEGVATVGLGVGLLLAVAWRRRREIPEAAFWFGGLGLVFVLALGVMLHVAGWTGADPGWLTLDRLRFGIPLPYAGFHFIPGLKQFRNPARFMLVGMLLAGVLCAYAVRSLRQQGRGRRALLLAGLVFFEYWALPFPSQPLRTPRAVDLLAHMPGSSPVLVVPSGWHGSYYQAGFIQPGLLTHQTVHRRKLFGGRLTRVGLPTYQAYLQSPFFLNLVLWQSQDDPTLVSNLIPRNLVPEARPAELERVRRDAGQLVEAFGIRYLLCYEPGRWRKTLEFVRSMMDCRPLWEDGEACLYRVTARPP